MLLISMICLISLQQAQAPAAPIGLAATTDKEYVIDCSHTGPTQGCIVVGQQP